jgi:hypothetical protein
LSVIKRAAPVALSLVKLSLLLSASSDALPCVEAEAEAEAELAQAQGQARVSARRRVSGGGEPVSAQVPEQGLARE